MVEISFKSLSIKIGEEKDLKKEIKYYFKNHINNDLDVCVAETEQDVVAIFCLSILTLLPRINSDNNKSAYLSHYYIEPAYDNKVLRKELFQRVISYAVDRQAEVFELAIIPNKISLYEKYAFKTNEFVAIHLMLEHVKWSKWEKNMNFLNLRKASLKDIPALVNMRINFLNEVSQSFK